MPLDELDRRIVGALQNDGRVSWRRVAEVLGAPERTVSHRGALLLEAGTVVVSGWHTPGTAAIVGVRGTPQTVNLTATALARRADTTFAYTLTGPTDCVAEVRMAPDALPTLLHDDLPGTVGLVGMTIHPVMRYFRTGHQWQPDLLTAAEATALREFEPPAQSPDGPSTSLTDVDRAIIRALGDDGRMPIHRLARIVDVSETTARRRLDALRRDGRLTVRAVVEPRHLGMTTEAALWIKAAPGAVDEIGELLIRHSAVRYAAAIAGEYQLFADVIVADRQALHRFITGSAALAHADAVVTSLVVTALKRSGVLPAELRAGRGEG